MKNTIIFGLIFFVIGLIVGYISFGYVMVHDNKVLIDITRIIGLSDDGLLNKGANIILDINNRRTKILFSGFVGFVLGFLGYAFLIFKKPNSSIRK